jgi:hypothetical protein
MNYLLYPFKKGSFWIIFTVSYSIVLLFPIVKGQVASDLLNRAWEYADWKLLFNIRPDESISVKWLIFELQLVFFSNYLGHLIFSHRDKEG